MKIFTLKILLPFLFVSVMTNTYAVDTYNGCSFSYANKSIEMSTKLTLLLVEGGHKKIYAWMCNGIGSGNYLIKPTKNNPNDPLAMKNGKYWLKVKHNNCEFDVFYSKVNFDSKEFIANANYNDKCGRRSSPTNSVKNIRLNSNNGSTKTYDVWCTNGSHGYVVVNESYISWTGNNSGRSTPYKVSLNEASRKLCY